MSGIAGIVTRDGSPIDPSLLTKFATAIAYRGPHRSKVWLPETSSLPASHMQVGLAHTLLHTTAESHRETQPYSFDNAVWIIADARIDGRDTLKQGLIEAGRQGINEATDVELILHAYHVWGIRCMQHLIGDFAFAIWDAPRQQVLCARDHFGMKPFYYATLANTFIFSSSIAALRHHPAVSDRLNEQAIGDFLALGCNYNENATIFADIQRIPPAHTLLITPDQVKLERYWDIPDPAIKDQIRYRRLEDYLEHFRQVFRVAVTDRLRTDNVAIRMSGGLDSTAIAAVAWQHLRQTTQNPQVVAHTSIYQRLFNDPEGEYAQSAADELGIPIQFHHSDDAALYNDWQPMPYRWEQPFDAIFPTIGWQVFSQISQHTHVALSGLGGDLALRVSASYYAWLVKKWRLPQLTREVAGHLRLYHTFKGLRFRSIFKQALGVETGSQPYYPEWLSGYLVEQTHLTERWSELTNPVAPEHTHREVYLEYTHPRWSCDFEYYANLPLPLEIRFPFYDTRLIAYLLAIPVFLCYNKTILRMATASILPEKIRLRRKTPLAGNPLYENLRSKDTEAKFLGKIRVVGNNYIDTAKYCHALNDYLGDPGKYYLSLTAPLSLEYWLQWYYDK